MKIPLLLRGCLNLFHAGLAIFTFVPPIAGQSSVTTGRDPRLRLLGSEIAWLAADARGGRFTGTAEADSVAAWLAEKFSEAGLAGPWSGKMLQSFTVAADAPAAVGTEAAGRNGVNVVGILPGRDPSLRNEYLVVGAHYDHLGTGTVGSLSPDRRGEIHNGADDNASGTVALLEMVRILSREPPARSIIFVAFSGEELGLLGSSAYVRNPPRDMASTVAMLNLDMVGRLGGSGLQALGAMTAAEFPALVDSVASVVGLRVTATGDGYGRSDHASFAAAKVPVLHLFTDLHEDYHRPSDDAERINLEGVAQVAEFGAAMVRAIGDRSDRLTYIDLPPPAPSAGASGGYGAYLGSIPDMSGGVTGVRITGVRQNSPADKVGMREGDIIRRIGDHPVEDLQGMTDALRRYRPGDTASIEIERAGTRIVLQVTFGTRGG